MNVRFGGYTDDIDRFDGTCFGIKRGEALLLDPQQRSLIEGVLEAKQTAAAVTPPTEPSSSSSSNHNRVSVYVGVGSQDFMGHVLANCYHAVNPYMITGNMTSVVCGRVSFLFGLDGPAASIDTGCSASLVSTHLAVG